MFGMNGAQERTRTSTSIRTLAPEASASTNSATWAGVVKTRISPKRGGCQRKQRLFGGFVYQARGKVVGLDKRSNGIPRNRDGPA